MTHKWVGARDESGRPVGFFFSLSPPSFFHDVPALFIELGRRAAYRGGAVMAEVAEELFSCPDQWIRVTSTSSSLCLLSSLWVSII